MKKPKKVIKVETDFFYKEKYVKISDLILSTTLAKVTFPYLTDKIDKAHNSLKPAKNAIKVVYKPFPSNEKMLEVLLKQREDIYKTLNLEGIKGKNNEIVKAGVLYLYLSKHTSYNDLANEEMFTRSTNKFLHKLIGDNIKEYYNLKQKLKGNYSKRERKEIQEKLQKLTQENISLQYKLEQKEIFAKNRMFLKSVYNVLTNQKGVCSDFSYAYQFLLEGLNMESLVVTTKSKDNVFKHTLNLNAYMDKGIKKYYFVDVTQGNAAFYINTKIAPMSSFATIKSKMLEEDDEMIYIEKLSILKEDNLNLIDSIDFPKDIKKIEDKIMTTYDLEKYVYAIENFIINGYKDMNLDETEKEK